MDNSQRVLLNVGGKKFETTVGTLTQRSVYFQSFLDRWTPDDIEEEIFIDRDPLLFNYVLAYMRTGQVLVKKPNDVKFKLICHEMEFFGTDFTPPIDHAQSIMSSILSKHWESLKSVRDKIVENVLEGVNVDELILDHKFTKCYLKTVGLSLSDEHVSIILEEKLIIPLISMIPSSLNLTIRDVKLGDESLWIQIGFPIQSKLIAKIAEDLEPIDQ